MSQPPKFSFLACSVVTAVSTNKFWQFLRMYYFMNVFHFKCLSVKYWSH